MTDVATIAGTIGALDTALDVTEKALGLLRLTRKASRNGAAADQQLLAMALLDVRHNLALLECLRVKGRDAGTDPALAQAAAALKVDTLTAMLVKWPIPGPERELGRSPAYVSRKDYDTWLADQDERDARGQLLAQALYIVTRTSALRSILSLPSEIISPIRPAIRLSNLKAAHLHLLTLLSAEGAVSHLTGTKRKTKGG